MKKKSMMVIFISFLLLSMTGAAVRAGEISPDLQNMLAGAADDDPMRVIIRLKGIIELGAYKDPDKALRRSKLIKALKVKTDASQKSLKKFLKDNGLMDKDVEVLWLINGVAVTVPAAMVEPLAARSDVEKVDFDAAVAAPAGISSPSATPEWNIEMIRAPEFWALGHDGDGVVVASLDTGVDYFHPDIGPQWRGGSNSWYDPNGEHAVPYDHSGHGTRVMGLIVGGDAGGTVIGAAPGAQWIAAKIFDDRGRSRLSRIHMAFQWVLDPDGDPDLDDAPDIVNNSWYLQNTVDRCNTEFSQDIAVLRTAGIAVVFSAGNTGPYAASSVSPSNNDGGVAVGAVDAFQYVAGFSGRGPSACSGDIYPALAAPGVGVLTADRTLGGVFPDSYISVSGTSFAAPHVSGAMALLLSALPGRTLSELELALQQTAFDLGPSGPDNEAGHGLVDPMAAFLVLTGPPAAPVAADDAYNAMADIPLSIAAPGVLANDVDANGDPLSARLASPPVSGSVSLSGDGSFLYIPNSGFTGSDNFTYIADDGVLDSNPAAVTITVVPAPVNSPPVANDDAAVTIEDVAVAIDVLANDTDADGDSLAVSTVSQGTNGSVTNNGGNLTYTPDTGFSGSDSFTYTAGDGTDDSNAATVTVTVDPAVNLPPVAANDAATVSRNTSGNRIDVVANDSDADGSIDASTVAIATAPDKGGKVAVNADGTVAYSPKKGFRGTEIFSYTVSDNEGAVSNTATVSVDVVK